MIASYIKSIREQFEEQWTQVQNGIKTLVKYFEEVAKL